MNLNVTRATQAVALRHLLLDLLPRVAETARSAEDEELRRRIAVMPVKPFGWKLLTATTATGALL